jgi:lipopolysaccharide transport system ATP-binding protein
VIRVEGVTKRFRSRGPVTVRELVLGRGHRIPPKVALDDIDLEVPGGEAVGLVGPNGAGKSTLLRLIGGVGKPSEGRITVDGRVSALLELGAGSQDDLTGRENVQLGLVVSGLRRAEARRRLDEVVAFAGLESVIDDPMRTYSNGMCSRLGFSIGVHADGDVLLVDEVLAVGDLAFQQRCLDRVKSLRAAGATLLLASHSPELVAAMCDHAVWLQAGRIVAQGAPTEVEAAYEAAVAAETARATPPDASLPTGATRYGSQVATVHDVALSTEVLRPGGSLTVQLGVDPGESGRDRFNLSVSVLRRDGVVCVDENAVVDAGVHTLTFDRLDLAPAEYAIDVGLYALDWGATYDYHQRAYALTVTGANRGKGVVAGPVRWERGGDRWLLGSSTSS